MPYKPRIIILLCLIYLLSPPALLLFSAYNGQGPLTSPGLILESLSLTNLVTLGLCAFISLCLFSVRKWGWWGFLFSSVYLIASHIKGYLSDSSHTPITLLLYILFMSGAAALLFRKELIAPYFNPRLRWWEAEKRYELNFQCQIKDDDNSFILPISDISRGGCFLATKREVPLGKIYTLEISINNLYLTLKGEVVRGSHSPVQGWGILFREVSLIEGRGLKELIELLKYYHGDINASQNKRKHKRYTNPFYIYIDGPAVKGEGRIHGHLENISKTGFCVVLEDGERLTKKRELTLELPHILSLQKNSGIERPLPAQIVWSRLGKPSCSLGAEFTPIPKEDRRRIDRIVHDFKKMGGNDRSRSLPNGGDSKLIDASIPLTPLGKVQSLFSKAN
ncbi:MAG: PilZ domain-containing protein [Spirochaetales bacterium]|nr:PilZ domain-containing protein [Spirochaetales bacterium]